MSDKVITRIAPSPTGLLHFGTARSALFNYLFAKKMNGIFIIRIEDTDKKRSEKKYEKDILDGLKKLGIRGDKIFRQSERTEMYKNYIKKLIDSEKAYISNEPKKDSSNETVSVVRLKNGGKKITFNDMVRGDITFDTKELGDFVIAKSVDEPLYHLAVVIDDYEMNVTHIIRGEDHISNTPRQVLIQEALEFERPKYAHMPLILSPDKTKMSKRHGAVSISEYTKNYLPEALVNYLALLGWNPGTDEEYFTLDELVEKFDISKIQKGGAVFNVDKLNSINHHYIMKLSDSDFEDILKKNLDDSILKHKNYTDEKLSKISLILKEKIKYFGEIEDMVNFGEFAYYFDAPEYEIDKVIWKTEDKKSTQKHLNKAIELFNNIEENSFTSDKIKEAVWDYAEKVGKGSVLWPIRYSLTGKDKSPDPFSVSEILGKVETIHRLKSAVEKLT